MVIADASPQSVSELFLWVSLVVAIVMLLWDTIEVGRNDATNLVNGVIGARIMTRQVAIPIAGVCVLFGTLFASPVIETARKGIFHTEMLTVQQLLAIYVSVYIVDTALLYSYSAFGMPVSTTACLVFELLGASFAMKFFEVVNWSTSGTVVFAIIFSIVFTGIAAFLVQRAVRGAIRDKADNLRTLLLHGGWVGGGMLAGLSYFMILKGMKSITLVKNIRDTVVTEYGDVIVIVFLWAFFAIVIHALLVIFGKRAAKLLFPTLTVLAMMCMAFAFGQNDLANCASPGLATLQIWKHGGEVGPGTEAPIPTFWLFVCGILLAAGMFTRNAKRVNQTAMRTGSMGDHVKLYAPNWCIAVAERILRLRGRTPALAPVARWTPRGKLTHYDQLRACVIMSITASVIATASSLGLPVSTTYVTFAAIVTTGMADRIYQRGDAALKLGRAVWTIFSWFAAAIIAAVATAVICRTIYHLGPVGIVACIGLNLTVRTVLKRRGDAQEKRIRQEAEERMHPEDFALEEE